MGDEAQEGEPAAVLMRHRRPYISCEDVQGAAVMRGRRQQKHR
jgi:3-methyladenine DNA glycosylase Mpg